MKVTASSPTEAANIASESFALSVEDNRENRQPIPYETSISARAEY